VICLSQWLTMLMVCLWLYCRVCCMNLITSHRKGDSVFWLKCPINVWNNFILFKLQNHKVNINKPMEILLAKSFFLRQTWFAFFFFFVVFFDLVFFRPIGAGFFSVIQKETKIFKQNIYQYHATFNYMMKNSSSCW
jgi:hypothetical protein